MSKVTEAKKDQCFTRIAPTCSNCKSIKKPKHQSKPICGIGLFDVTLQSYCALHEKKIARIVK